MGACDCETRMVFYVYKPVTLHIEAAIDDGNDDEFAVMYTMDEAYGHEEYKDFRNGADNELEPGVYGLWSTGPVALKRMLIDDSSHLEVRFDVMRKDPWPRPPPPPPSVYGKPSDWDRHRGMFMVPLGLDDRAAKPYQPLVGPARARKP